MKQSNVREESCDENIIIKLKDHYDDMRKCMISLNEILLALDKSVAAVEWVCSEQRSALEECYKINKHESLKCSDVVRNFINCSRSSRNHRLREIRYNCSD
ncbi:unnamed protein product [Euphydryas editha]|uniref:Coiled-coil-helix-coiled-coil-helix domain-containing protein 5 n=1 Tax=Euphydryas editha TaxID=104508 RepID=A0AAU9UX43_EUPED|nr:unnamed protein product [Euphydryas editha]